MNIGGEDATADRHILEASEVGSGTENITCRLTKNRHGETVCKVPQLPLATPTCSLWSPESYRAPLYWNPGTHHIRARMTHSAPPKSTPTWVVNGTNNASK